MDTPVFKLYLSKLTMDAVLMPEDRQPEAWAKYQQIHKDAGMRNLITGIIFSDERYRYFGVEMFPNWQAMHEHDRCLDEMHWFQYFNARTYVGVAPDDMPENMFTVNLDPAVSYLAQVWVIKNTPVDDSAEAWRKNEQPSVFNLEKELGVLDVVIVKTRPVDETTAYFGVQLFPSLEALVAKTRAQEKINWWRYIQAETYLGVPEDGELIKK